VNGATGLAALLAGVHTNVPTASARPTRRRSDSGLIIVDSLGTSNIDYHRAKAGIEVVVGL
jgi:hypothetical protein